MRSRLTSRRKTTPRVRDGVVARKHRWAPSRDADDALLGALEAIAFDERAPGVAHRHVVSVIDVRRFLRCLPDADRHLDGLRAIVLARGAHDDLLGHYDERGIITLCSWPADLVGQWEPGFVDEHAATLRRLAVPTERAADPDALVTLYFDERSARAFQLVHIFLHELGHHRDRMARRRRGEDFAESWALEMEALVWPRYLEWFGRPGRKQG